MTFPILGSILNEIATQAHALKQSGHVPGFTVLGYKTAERLVQEARDPNGMWVFPKDSMGTRLLISPDIPEYCQVYPWEEWTHARRRNP